MGLVLDSGAMIAFERGDRQVAALVEAARRRKERVVTSSGCVAQVWRDGTRQVLLARLLAGTVEEPLGPAQSRSVGRLCAAARTGDVVDAHLASLAGDRDIVLSSDPAYVRHLLGATGSAATVHPC
ncbi:MAG TPA: hypothetical protein VGO87_07050 [Acidimicrobiia bacterium]|jgi:hypothetical protein